ncbi:MAG: glycoside hydrolase family 2 [Candidatus Rokubacteria bacterium]|nr:glycoside hydrolase family 2 [Candidatus Rokubacteria bacterium]
MSTGHAYPRPQLRRADWTSLNGVWDFALDLRSRWAQPDDVEWDRTILVPFAPETPRSGVDYQGFFEACWYRRRFAVPALGPRQRLILHFGAVDYEATVWVNGREVGRHEGGYTPFALDVTDALTGDNAEIVVRAHDDPLDMAKPRGKQDWELEPHAIWYPRTSGIWQTVWVERVSATYIGSVRWTPSLERWEIGLAVLLDGVMRDDVTLGVTIRLRDTIVAADTYRVVAGEVHRRISLSEPGIDDFRNTLLWSPRSPTLLAVDLTLTGQDGEVLDRATSYTALRSIAVQGDRIVLNGRPYPLRMVLDQGYWPDTGMTAPDDAALRRDVELAKALGFNGVRKHQKLEDPRFLYWADRLGLLVWGEMPSAYRFTRQSVERMTREWSRAVARDYSHPCIVAWVPFNESWGVPNLPDSAAEQHYVRAMYHLTKTLDPTRPVIGNDGWESVATDIVGVHDYEEPGRMARRYHSDDARPQLFRRERPGGRVLALAGAPPLEHPIVLSEFGGIAICKPGDEGWGYARCGSAAEMAARYGELMRVVHSLELIAGFCYTQLTDTYQEANGLLYADRTPKFPIAEIAEATRGPRSQLDLLGEWMETDAPRPASEDDTP